MSPPERVTNHRPSANPIHLLAFTSFHERDLACAHTHSMSNFPTPTIINLWYNSLAVGANKRSASLSETPKALIPDQHPIAPPGKTERDGAHSSQLHPTRHGRPMAPACICKHLNTCCDRVGSEGHAASRAGKKVVCRPPTCISQRCAITQEHAAAHFDSPASCRYFGRLLATQGAPALSSYERLAGCRHAGCRQNHQERQKQSQADKTQCLLSLIII